MSFIDYVEVFILGGVSANKFFEILSILGIILFFLVLPCAYCFLYLRLDKKYTYINEIFKQYLDSQRKDDNHVS